MCRSTVINFPRAKGTPSTPGSTTSWPRMDSTSGRKISAPQTLPAREAPPCRRASTSDCCSLANWRVSPPTGPSPGIARANSHRAHAWTSPSTNRRPTIPALASGDIGCPWRPTGRILAIVHQQRLTSAYAAGVNSTTFETNAFLKRLVRKNFVATSSTTSKNSCGMGWWSRALSPPPASTASVRTRNRSTGTGSRQPIPTPYHQDEGGLHLSRLQIRTHG